MSVKRSRQGQPWLEDEKQELRAAFLAGQSPETIAENLDRGVRGIFFQLVSQNLIDYDDKTGEWSPRVQTSHALNVADHNSASDKPEQHGFSWAVETEEKLRSGFTGGKTVEQLAEELGRSQASVKIRLRKLGLITDVAKPCSDDETRELPANLQKQIEEGKSQRTYEPVGFPFSNFDPETLRQENFISVRLANVLRREGFNDIRDTFYLKPRQLLKYQNLGSKSYKELEGFRNSHFVEKILSATVAETPAVHPSSILGEVEGRLATAVERLQAVSEQSAVANAKGNDPQRIAALKIELREAKKQLRSAEYDLLKSEHGVGPAGSTEAEIVAADELALKIPTLLDEVIADCTKDARSAYILRDRLGLGPSGSLQTLQTIGEQFSVTRERIRQLEKKAKSSLRNHLSNPCLYASNELRKLSEPYFCSQSNDPTRAIVEFCLERFGVNGRSYELAICLTFSVKIFKHYKSAKQAVFQISKEIFERQKQEAVEFAKDQNAIRKWSQIFAHVLYPEVTARFDGAIPGFEKSLRMPNETSLGHVGSYFSDKCSRDVHYESGTEFRLYQTLENASKVWWYQEQPVAIPYSFNGNTHAYYPDIAALTDEGRGVVIEVKPLLDMVLLPTLRKALAAIDHLHEKGIGFLIADARGQSIQTLMEREVDPDIAGSITRAIDREGFLDSDTYFDIIAGTTFSVTDFASMVVQNDLCFTRNRFRLSRLPDDLSFQKWS